MGQIFTVNFYITFADSKKLQYFSQYCKIPDHTMQTENISRWQDEQDSPDCDFFFAILHVNAAINYIMSYIHMVRQRKTVPLIKFNISAIAARIWAKLSYFYVSMHATYHANFIETTSMSQQFKLLKLNF